MKLFSITVFVFLYFFQISSSFSYGKNLHEDLIISNVRKYVSDCAEDFDFEKIEKEVYQAREKIKELSEDLLDSSFIYNFYQIDGNIPEVNFNGLILKDVDFADIAILAKMTSIKKYTWYEPVIKDLEIENINGTIHVKTECIKADCVKSNFKLDLSAYNDSEVCSDSVCVMKKIFGEQEGLLILLGFFKYNSNLSPLNYDETSLNNKPDLAFLMASLRSYEILPPHLRDQAVKNKGFFPSQYDHYGKTVANSSGTVYSNNFDGYSYQSKVAIFVHELGHRVDPYSIDFFVYKKRTPEFLIYEKWLEVGGWAAQADSSLTEIYFEDKSSKPNDFVTKYASTNSVEDFAESFLYYRFAPEILKETAPLKYQFLKEYTFQGLEYSHDICHGQRLD